MGQIIYPKRIARSHIIGSQLYSDLIAGWEFGANSGNIGIDLKRVHNTSSNNNVASTIDNSFPLDNQALTYTATPGNIRIPYNAGLSLSNKSFTIVTLFKFNSNSQSELQLVTFFAKDFFENNLRTCHIFAIKPLNSSTYGYHFSVANGVTTRSILEDTTIYPVTNTDWHLILCEYNSLDNTQKLYVDNNELLSTTVGFSVQDTSYDYGLCGRFSNYTNYDVNTPYGSNTMYYYKFIYLFHKILTQEEKDYLWNNGNFTYLSKTLYLFT